MSKKEMRNQYDEKKATTNVTEEIREQDLESQVSGGGVWTAIQLSIAKKCGGVITVSYECTSNNIRCK